MARPSRCGARAPQVEGLPHMASLRAGRPARRTYQGTLKNQGLAVEGSISGQAGNQLATSG